LVILACEGRTANRLLTNGVSSTEYRDRYLLRGVAVHACGHVGVDVQRDADRRVPEPLLHDLRVHSGR
jgi:hypothetical protein